jgi:hypothetical protein
VRIVAPTAIFLIALPFAAIGYKDGPPPGVTGGFGEPSCQQCHFDQPVNESGGMLSLAGVPARYTPGSTYQVTVTLTRDAMTRGGFEISARYASGGRTSRQAGAWRALDSRVQVVRPDTDPAVDFVQHTSAGSTAPQPGTISWTMRWTAPDEATDPVQFDVAGNASNDDASPLGDYVYTETRRSVPDRQAAASLITEKSHAARGVKMQGFRRAQ